jgi:hypothetical protein
MFTGFKPIRGIDPLALTHAELAARGRSGRGARIGVVAATKRASDDDDDQDDDDEDEKEEDDEGGGGECDDDDEGGGDDTADDFDKTPKPKRKDDTVKRKKAKPDKNKPDDDGTGDEKKAAAGWDRAIRAKMAQGLPRDRAARAVAHERPRLREHLVAAANSHVGRAGRSRQSSGPSADSKMLQSEWNRLVEQEMQSVPGLSAARANSAVAKKYPHLRSELVAAANRR